MNLGQNKFFVGFGAVLAIGCLGLAWLGYSSYSAYDDATNDFNTKAAKLNELQTLPLYPDKANAKILEDQEKVAADSVVALQEKLAPMSFPLEQLSPEQFQDRLNAAVKTLSEKAAQAGIAFPEKQNLGFAQYRSSVPKPEAAAVLGRQLKCVELAVSTLLDQKITAIEVIDRKPLPEELDMKVAPTPDPKAKKQGGKPQAEPLLKEYPLTIKFVGEQGAFRAAINELSKNTSQFYIIRNVKIENQMAKPPKRADEQPKDAASSDSKAQPNQLKYIFGGEKLKVTLDFDYVVFASNLPK